MRPHLSLVIPAYNEALRIGPSIAALGEFGRALAFPYEIILVIERSSDGTLAVARELTNLQPQFTVIDNAVHRGKGFAVRAGMLRAEGEFVFYMDADLSVPLHEVGNFLAQFAARPEVAVLIGNRQHPQSRIIRKQSFLRRKLGQGFNVILKRLQLAALYDTQCGFKAFRAEAAQAIFSRQTIDGFAFDVEVLLLARALGFKVADLPVEWINSTESHVHIIADSLAMLRDAIRLRRLAVGLKPR